VTERERRSSEVTGEPAAAPSRLAPILAVVGGVAVLVAVATGDSVRGLSAGTVVHALGVLALAVAGGLAARRLVRFFREDPRGKPTVGLLLLFFVAASGWLVARVLREVAAGRLWSELEALLASDDPAAAPRLVARFPDVPESEMRVRFVRRLGELRDGRAVSFLRQQAGLAPGVESHPEPEVRRAAAEAVGRVGGEAVVDPLIEILRGPGDHERVLIALRGASGANPGKSHGAWTIWRLEKLLDEGTPEAVGDVLRRLGRVEDGVYRQIRGRVWGLSDPALRRTFEATLTGKLEGVRQLDRRGVAAVVLSRIGDPASIPVLRRAFARSRELLAEGKIRDTEADAYWDILGKAMRILGGKDVLADSWVSVFTFFLELLEDGDEMARNFAADHLEALTKQKHGLDRAAWMRWREGAEIDRRVADGDSGPLVLALRVRVREGDVDSALRLIRALATIGDARALSALRGMVRQSGADPRVRRLVLLELGKREDGLDRDTLLSLLESEEDASLVRSVVVGLGRHDETRVVKALHERYLVEDDSETRRTIVVVLRRLTVDAVYEALVDAVADEFVRVAEAAAEELTKRTGKHFGTDAEKWRDWYRRNFR
jgi:HEAT repeat protein